MPLTLAQLDALSQSTFPTRAASRRDDDGYAALHATIGAAVEPIARALQFDMHGFKPRAQLELLQLPPHIFLVWCDESDLMPTFYALPEAELPPTMAQALHAVAGLKFRAPGELALDQRGALLRVMAALGSPHARDAEDFYNGYVGGADLQNPELPSQAEIAELFDSFAPCFIPDAAGLDRRFSRVITVHRTV